MVRELEDKLKEMKADAESKLTEKKDEEDAEKMAEKKDEEKAEKLAHTPDHNDEKKGYNMNENSIMLSEVTALREANAQLSERLETIESEKRAVEMKAAVDNLLREGRIAPSDEGYARTAYELKELQPEFWKMFSERPANSAVPLQQIGHGASGAEINQQTLHKHIEGVAEEKGFLFSEALKLVQKFDTEFYIKAMGV